MFIFDIEDRCEFSWQKGWEFWSLAAGSEITMWSLQGRRYQKSIIGVLIAL